ncbi:uncharacterized protein LOC130824843 [Amaranthus tricolor]|uniref:uncharacterized protein LOC130824843 n=1 Tax=Amaranthus tricolor TaxID=29722 RepID=UPI00258E01C4|nr:uncharacterized protein LOC130824843 [Amaranthus tricolor]
MSCFIILTSFILLLTTQLATAVTYTVTNAATNTPGGARFDNEIGSAYARQTLSTATNFIWKTFRQFNPTDRKSVQQVSLIVENMEEVAYTSNNQIHQSAKYIQNYPGNVKTEVTGILYHEMTHTWQWSGNGRAPGGLIEGIADFVRLKAGYAPSHWVKPGQGDRWDQGYDVTARFLDYCDSLRNGFVAQLNKKMRYGYSDAYFSDLLGKSVGQLWNDYKAKFNN